MSQRQMHLGVLLLAAGNVVSGWRLPEAQAGAQNYDLIEATAKKAESGKLDFLFLADGLNSFPKMHPSMVLRLEPLTLLGALTRVTTRIGLAVTASTTYTEPYNLGRRSIISVAAALPGISSLAPSPRPPRTSGPRSTPRKRSATRSPRSSSRSSRDYGIAGRKTPS